MAVFPLLLSSLSSSVQWLSGYLIACYQLQVLVPIQLSTLVQFSLRPLLLQEYFLDLLKFMLKLIIVNDYTLKELCHISLFLYAVFFVF